MLTFSGAVTDRPLSALDHPPVRSLLRILIVVVLVTLVGCAGKERPPPPPPVVIPASTWRLIDSEIFAASQDASGEASEFAKDRMNRWRNLVYQRTDAEFVPWFSSYWTRQWLSLKVTWYKMSAEGEREPVVDRLAHYLREQYQERVLEPVAEKINPDWIMAQTTLLYVRQLRSRIQELGPRYRVPTDQLDQRLQKIPAISLAPPANHNASLYQLVHAEPIDNQPAYLALVARIQSTPGRPGDWSEETGLSSVARRTSESLINELTTRSVAGAISAAVGRAAGAVISLGTAGFTAMLRERERPEMEGMLRKNLDAAFDEKWLDWLNDPDRGVMAGVHHLSGQIEGSLADRVGEPVRYEPPSVGAPAATPAPMDPPVRYRTSESGTQFQIW